MRKLWFVIVGLTAVLAGPDVFAQLVGFPQSGEVDRSFGITFVMSSGQIVVGKAIVTADGTVYSTVNVALLGRGTTFSFTVYPRSATANVVARGRFYIAPGGTFEQRTTLAALRGSGQLQGAQGVVPSFSGSDTTLIFQVPSNAVLSLCDWFALDGGQLKATSSSALGSCFARSSWDLLMAQAINVCGQIPNVCASGPGGGARGIWNGCIVKTLSGLCGGAH